jgi:hypothetical protein
MDTKQRFETQRIDHLGIVAGISQEIGLIAEIDRLVGILSLWPIINAHYARYSTYAQNTCK